MPLFILTNRGLSHTAVRTRLHNILHAMHNSGGIACLSFGLGPRGQGDALLTSIGLDSDHTLAVHDWQQKRLLAKSPTDKGKVRQC
jgi:hypothetical protein